MYIWTYLQGKNRDIDTESHEDTVGEDQGGEDS